MFSQSKEDHAKLEALNRSQAVIEFSLDGRIQAANANFLSTVGYTLDEIVGRHHRMFVSPEDYQSTSYSEFWAALNRGEFQSAEFRRVTKSGREIWLQATYNPLIDRAGVPYKIVKFCTDITARKMQAADLTGQIEAINTSQAVISFTLDGHVLSANANFLNATGYTLDESRASTTGCSSIANSNSPVRIDRSGIGSAVASSKVPSIVASAREAGRFGCRPPIIRSSIRPTVPTKSSSSVSTLLSRFKLAIARRNLAWQ